MKNDLLTMALNVSLEDIEPVEQQDDVIDVVDTEGVDNGIQLEEAIATQEEVEQRQEELEVIKSMVESASEEDTVAMESLSKLVDVISAAYGGENTSLESMSGADVKASVIERIDLLQSSLESALTVSQEAWGISDLWNAQGAVERNIKALDENVKQLSSRKEWFSNNGLPINSTGILQYITVENKPTNSLFNDVNALNKHVKAMLDIATKATAVTEEISKKVAAGLNGADEIDKLTKAVAKGRSPVQEAKQQLDNTQLLGNLRYYVEHKMTKSANLGDWSAKAKVGFELNDKWHGGARTHKASLALRIPVWVVGAKVGAALGRTTALAVGGGAPLVIGYSLLYGYAAVDALNAHKTAKKAQHLVKFDDAEKSFREVSKMAASALQSRKAITGRFKRLFEGRSSTYKALAGATDLRAVYVANEQLAWKLFTDAFILMRMSVTNCEIISRKMLKASK